MTPTPQPARAAYPLRTVPEANPGLRRARWILRITIALAVVGVSVVVGAVLLENEVERYDVAGLIGEHRPFANVAELTDSLNAELYPDGKDVFIARPDPTYTGTTLIVWGDWFQRRRVRLAIEARLAHGGDDPRQGC